MESSQEEAQRLRKLEIAARLEENCKSFTYVNEKFRTNKKCDSWGIEKVWRRGKGSLWGLYSYRPVFFPADCWFAPKDILMAGHRNRLKTGLLRWLEQIKYRFKGPYRDLPSLCASCPLWQVLGRFVTIQWLVLRAARPCDSQEKISVCSKNKKRDDRSCFNCFNIRNQKNCCGASIRQSSLN